MSEQTPYADVNVVLTDFLARIRGILGPHFRGMYLDGSLALGDFNPQTSDIDFVVTTATDLNDAHFDALRVMHADFNASRSPWATEVEAVYLLENSFRRSDPANVRRLRIERGNETLVKGHSDRTWIVHWSIVREHRVVLAGPDPRTFIDPIDPQDLRRVMADLADAWLIELRQNHDALQYRGPMTYSVLTFCRMLYTLTNGAVVSKPVAARWARQAQEGRWAALIERALAWRKDPAFQEPVSEDEQQATRAFLDYTVAQCHDLDCLPTQPEP